MAIKEEMKKKKNILHIVEAVLALIALALIAGVACFKCYDNYFENQFIDATIFGFFLISVILVVMIFFEETLDKTVLVVCILGAIMYIITSILLFTYLNKTYFGANYDIDHVKGRSMAAMVVCLLLGLLYLFEFIIALAKPDLLE